MNWKMMALLTGIIVGFGSTAHPQTSSSAVARVRVQILPRVSVSAVTQLMDLGSFRTGTMGANLVYHIDANSPKIAVFVEVSAFHRMQGSATWGEPIPLSTPAGVEIHHGSGPASRLPISTRGRAIDGLPTYKSEVGHLRSSRSIFREDVTVHVTWEQKDPDRAPGEYGAVVRLTTMVLQD